MMLVVENIPTKRTGKNGFVCSVSGNELFEIQGEPRNAF